MQSDVSLSQVNESNVTVELTANVSLLLASCLPADVEECAQVRQVRTGRGGGGHYDPPELMGQTEESL